MVGRTHEIKGQAIAAFVTVKEGIAGTPELAEELRQHVARKIGAIAKPDDIIFAADLPKTRSGKIMRRLLRDIAEGKALGDTRRWPTRPLCSCEVEVRGEGRVAGYGFRVTGYEWRTNFRSVPPSMWESPDARSLKPEVRSLESVVQSWASSKRTTCGRPT